MRIQDIDIFEGLDLLSPNDQFDRIYLLASKAVEHKTKNIDLRDLTASDMHRIADECARDMLGTRNAIK
jgi:hypothetical protein